MSRQAVLLGVLGTVLVVALWWLFLYAPGQDELAAIEDEIAAAEAEQASLETRIAALEAVRARAPETEAAIARLRSLVPDDPALPSALRQLTAAALDAGIDVTAVATSRPEVVDEAIGLNAAGVSITATGSYFQLVDFLRRVEDPQITARGLTFSNLAVTTAVPPTLTISLTGQMYAVLEPPPEPDGEQEAAPADDGTEDDDGAEGDS